MELNFNLLSGKTALITGASSGIGKETALTFAKNGANLILISRNEVKLKELSKDLEKFNIVVDYYVIDITNTELLKNLFTQIKKSKVIIDVVVNNAGIMEDAVLQMVRTESIKRTFDTNVFALIDISKRASRLMIRNKKGSIINLSSIIGSNGSKGQSIYSASKAAVIGFTKSLSKELGPLNIRVNSIAPGFIMTGMTEGIADCVVQDNLKSISLGRLGTTKDVANVILFLASDLSEYVTGQVIGVDGGMVI
ncbi:3-oxoacyl-[acyl-carrier-protein] reductase FabG [Polaribacter huanghezhanensis]|uniref:SDR family NAD(P)-dependent oxidoreductase n=1 Tax=Polaribacter huanghezhanensis TaxID=1354726 RepID=UPI002648FBEE|nr:SDR family NAD(P)-dependent oxidoreductase [Polaribacter huanghezhanensis]WKD86113.1 3-oxoacyl-[acyl-carrier-protein] reductase FabG [Polaribacter huanghezhanensis]